MFVLVTFVIVVAVPAYVQPLASSVEFRYPLVPIFVMAVANCFSYVGWRNGLRGTLGEACTLIDTSLPLAAFQLAAVLSAPPASYAYAGVAGLVVLAVQSRLYGLTLIFGAAVCAPLGLVPLVFGADAPLLILSFSACVLALWSSHMTRTANRLRRQNLRLRSALETANEIVDQDRQVMLAGLLLDVGYFVHEIRNAQSCMGINFAYLLDHKPSGDELEECLHDLNAGNKRLQGIVDETVAMLKARSVEDSATFCVGDALGELPTGYRDAQVKRIDTGPLAQVKGMQRDLVGAVSQLIRNAAQAGAKRIEVAAKPAQAGSAVEIFVDDDGPGVLEAQRKTLFKPSRNASS